MYVILTNKPGLYHTRIQDHADIVESYDYNFYGKLKAIYDIARLSQETHVQIIEDEPPYVANTVRTKFLDKFDSLEEARAELDNLATFGSIKADLVLRKSHTSSTTADTAETRT